MKKSIDFNNILDDCLERLLVKGKTIEQCLQSYPEQADELEPLLQTAMAAKQASAIQPHPEFRARARHQLHQALQTVKPKKRFSLFGWQSRWATVVTAVLILVLVGGGTVTAASNSMPDNPLYPVKLATEQVQLTLTPSALGKAELHTKLADKRVAEIIYTANKGEAEQVEKVTQLLTSHLSSVAVLVAPQRSNTKALLAPESEEATSAPAQSGAVDDTHVQVSGKTQLRMAVARQAVNHSAALRAVLETAPASVKPALRRAILASEADYEQVLEALD